MPIHPIEFRYFYPDMREVFAESKLKRWLDVEAALA
jgi:adenylosuccinate lyase